MNSTSYSEAQKMAAEILFDELLQFAEETKASSPKNRSVYDPAQIILAKLRIQKYVDALDLLSPNHNPVGVVIERLLAVKNPNCQGNGIKKKAHTRRPKP